MSSHRFNVAFSFPGERRGKVAPIAAKLAQVFGEKGVLYDKYHDAEFARPDLDVHLPSLYRVGSELVVVFLCPAYRDKRWCRLEWRHIRQFIATADAGRIMFLSFGDPGDLTEIGVLSGDGYIDIDSLTADEVAAKILKRLELNRGESDSTQHDPQKTAARPNNLPYLFNPHFTGRETEMAALHETLTAGMAATVTQPAIAHGLGGVGKTQLAVQYAWTREADFTALLWAVADDPDELPANLAALAGPDALDLPEAVATEQEVQLRAVLDRLAAGGGWLLILDSVDSEAAQSAVEAILTPRLRHAGQIIVTSRLAHWEGHFAPLAIETLPVEKAADFLLERTKETELSRADAEALAGELGGLPLALEQAAAYVLHHRTTLAAYREKFASSRDLLLAEKAKTFTGYEETVATTWLVSMDQLGPAAREILRRCAFLAPDEIPRRLFEHGAENQEFEMADSDAVEAGLVQLADHSLVKLTPDSLSLHRLVQTVQESLMDEDAHAAALRRTLEMVEGYAPANPNDVRTWDVWDPLRPHALALISHAKRAGAESLTTDLMGGLATLLKTKALHPEAEDLERRALELDETRLGSDAPIVATRLNNLAQTLQATNRLAEAEPLMRRALVIDEQSFGPEHPTVAIRLNNLAQLLQATNRLAEAEPLMRRALDIVEQSFGPEHPNVAVSLNNLATLLQATNRLAEAEPLMRRALDIDEQSFGPEHPEVATDLNNLALLLQDTNRLAEAEPLMRRALAIDEQSFGPEHPNVASVLNNLALLLQATNRLAEAEPLMRRVVEIFSKFGETTGHEHPHMQTVIGNYRRLLEAMELPEDEIERRIAESGGRDSQESSDPSQD